VILLHDGNIVFDGAREQRNSREKHQLTCLTTSEGGVEACPMYTMTLVSFEIRVNKSSCSERGKADIHKSQ